MKTFRLFTNLSLIIVATNFLISCRHEADYRLFLIKVDSIQVSNALVATEPFDINFFGTIGGNGCYSFSSFNVRQDNLNILIEAWGRVDKATICPTVMVYLTGHNVTYTVQIPGTYNIKIKQPDNSYLEKQIAIK
jgi:hypothetical protein